MFLGFIVYVANLQLLANIIIDTVYANDTISLTRIEKSAETLRCGRL